MIPERVQRTRILNNAIHLFESVITKRAFYIIEAQIKKGMNVQFDITGETWVTVPTELLGRHSFEDLDNASDELQNVKFKFIDKEKEHLSKITPFPVVNYRKGWGHYRVKVEKEALQFLAELKEGYSWYMLKAALSLKSSYSQRWYELFCERQDLKKWNNVSNEKIRELHNVSEDSYEQNKEFFRNVVYKPIKEINEKTDLYIDYTPMMGKKRPIIGFDFTIKKQQTKESREITEVLNKYFDELSKMSPQQIRDLIFELMEKYGWSEDTYNKILANDQLLDEVLEAHRLIEDGLVTVNTTDERYMGGILRKYN